MLAKNYSIVEFFKGVTDVGQWAKDQEGHFKATFYRPARSRLLSLFDLKAEKNTVPPSESFDPIELFESKEHLKNQISRLKFYNEEEAVQHLEQVIDLIDLTLDARP